MTTIDTHALNKILAKVAGVEVMEISGTWRYYPPDADKEWDPCHGANQMEEVKAKLREKVIYHRSIYVPQEKIYKATLYCNDEYFDGQHESELIALALAIKAMEEGK